MPQVSGARRSREVKSPEYPTHFHSKEKNVGKENGPLPGVGRDSLSVEHLRKSLTTSHYKEQLQNTKESQQSGSESGSGSDQSSGTNQEE